MFERGQWDRFAGSLQAVLEGIRDSLGKDNPINDAKARLPGLLQQLEGSLPVVEEEESGGLYDRLLGVLRGLDSSLQSYRRIMITTQSFLLAAAAWSIRLPSALGEESIALPDVIVALAILLVGPLLLALLWRTCSQRALAVTYVNALVRSVEEQVDIGGDVK